MSPKENQEQFNEEPVKFFADAGISFRFPTTGHWRQEMRIFTHRRWASALTITAFVGAIPVAAQTPVTVYGEPSDIRTERVNYRDLNLATRDGEKILTQRVGGAVRRVCSDTGHIGLYSDRFYCTSGAWKDARPQMSQAIARAREIALYGKSSIAMTAITIKVR